jgi:molecular chaperone DnaK
LFTRIIEHNATIPLKKTMTFTTVVDNQTAVEIHVLQGERDLAQYNRSLAKFDLLGIAPGPRGMPQIEVAFDMDANAILSVSARDVFSGKEQAIKVTPSTGLFKEEIDRMIVEAKQYQEKDQRSRESTELRNRIKAQASILVRSYSGFGKLLDVVHQELVREALQKAKDLDPEESDISVLRDLMGQLESCAARLSAAMFNAPDAEVMGASGLPQEDINKLMKSALKDISQK